MKLVFLDIDGTLTVPGENTPPKGALQAIRTARENGHKVFLSTGRNPAMCAPLLDFGFDGMIACAGGYVRYKDTVLYDHPMTQRQLQTAMEVLHKDNVFRTIEALDATYGDSEIRDIAAVSHEVNSELERWRKELADTLNIRPMEAYDGRPIYKIVIMCEKMEQLDNARQLLEEEFDFCMQTLSAHADCVNGDLINRAFSKATGMDLLCRHLGVSPADTIAFGDSVNDIPMLEAAGMAVCMENGDRELQALSDFVSPAVDREGLAKSFQALGLV